MGLSVKKTGKETLNRSLPNEKQEHNIVKT